MALTAFRLRLALLSLFSATQASEICTSSGDPMLAELGESMLQIVQHKRNLTIPQTFAAPQTSSDGHSEVVDRDLSAALVGSMATLDDRGFMTVAGSNCELEMELYIRRLIKSLGLQLCSEDGLMSLLPLYSKCSAGAGCNFSTLLANVSMAATLAPCAFLAPVGSCPQMQRPSSCLGKRDASSHRRRQCNARIQRGNAVLTQATSDSPGNAVLTQAPDNIPPGTCDLPAGAVWCEVRLMNLPPFWIAAYDWSVAEDWVSYNICQSGYWEDKNIEDFGVPGHMLDIGGNIGFHSFAFAQAGWSVTTFEPMEANLRLIHASLCRNPVLAQRIAVNGFGLGLKNEKCKVMSPQSNIGDGFTRCAEAAAATPRMSDENEFREVGEFDIRRLDEVLQEQEISKVDLVKIDVEGYEYQVLASAPNFLTLYRPRLIKSEVWNSMVGVNAPVSAIEYLRLFEDAGYQFFYDSKCEVSRGAKEEVMRRPGGVDVFICS